MKLKSAQVLSSGKRFNGMTLLEVMIAMCLSSMLLTFAGSMYLFGTRSFVAMGNYVDLDAKSRNAVDLMSRDIRESTQVTAFQNDATFKKLTMTNAFEGTGATYIWNATPRTLVCRKSGQPDKVYLTECDAWNFELYQRTPQSGGGYDFVPATNAPGVYDLTLCKLVNMSWICSRTIIGSKVNTESVQTAQVVLRNKQ
jgi:prepilin-type N-terminal cleavage/methylation domain-containing protein